MACTDSECSFHVDTEQYINGVWVTMPELKDGDKAIFEACKDPGCPVEKGGLPHGHLINVDRADEYAGPVHVVLPAENTQHNHSPLATAILDSSDVTSWLSIPLDELMQLVADYTTWVETAETTEVCKCEWLIHPDDVDKKPEEGKRRMRRGDTSLDCPAHTKEGYLLGFFEWLKRDHTEIESDESLLAATSFGEAMSNDD